MAEKTDFYHRSNNGQCLTDDEQRHPNDGQCQENIEPEVVGAVAKDDEKRDLSRERDASLREMFGSWRFVMLIFLHLSIALSILSSFTLPMVIICSVKPKQRSDDDDNVTIPPLRVDGNYTEDYRVGGRVIH